MNDVTITIGTDIDWAVRFFVVLVFAGPVATHLLVKAVRSLLPSVGGTV